MKRIIVFLILLIVVWLSNASFIVTEVFIDWTHEYIEIQNQWAVPYTWIIHVDWVKSSTISINITEELLPNEYVILWDSSIPLLKPLCQIFTGQSISLVDSKKVDISVSWLDWNSNSSIDSEIVTWIDNEKRSFIASDWKFIPITTSWSQNIQEWYYWSPCVWDLHTNIWDTNMISWENTHTITTWTITWSWIVDNVWWVWNDSQWYQPQISTWTNTNAQVLTWSNQQYDNTSWSSQVLPPNTISSISDWYVQQCTTGSTDILDTWTIKIIWVSPKKWELSDEFLILESSQYFSWLISIVWWWRSSATTTHSVKLYPFTPVIIAKSTQWFSNRYTIYENNSLSLTDSWETIELQEYNWILQDQVKREWSSKDTLRLYNTSYTWSINLPSWAWTVSSLFTVFNESSCVLTYDWLSLKLLSTSICDLPGWSQWIYNYDQVLEWSCEWWVDTIPFTWWLLEYRKTIWETILCSTHIDIQHRQTISQINIPTTIVPWSVTITEVSPREWIFPEYIEINVKEWVEWVVEIVGLWQGSTSKTISVFWPQRYVITDTFISSLSEYNQIVLNSISLTDWWETLEVRQWWQLIDTFIYSWSLDEMMSRNVNNDKSISIYQQNPWFTIEQVSHLLPSPWEQQFSCSIRTQNTSPFTSTNKLNLVAHTNWKDITNATSVYLCSRNFGQLEYTSEYREENRCNPWYLAFPDWWIYEVWLTITDSIWKICKTQITINAPLLSNSESSNSSWKWLYYQWLYKKWKGRFQSLKKNIWPFGLTTNASWSMVTMKNTTTQDYWERNGNTAVVTVWSLQIVKLLPNPSWSDLWNEKVVIVNPTNEWISGIWWYIDNWKSKKALDKYYFPSRQEIDITGSLWLVNSNRCISLISPENEYHDRFCYWVADDDQWFTSTNTGIENLLSTSNSVWIQLSEFKIKLYDSQSCIQYWWTDFLCKELPVDKQTLIQLKKDAKKSLSREKKYTTELERRKKYQEQFRIQKKKATTMRKEHKEKLATQKQRALKYYTQLNEQKRLLKIYRWLISLRKDLLNNQYRSLYIWSWFETWRKAYKHSLDLFYTNKPIHYGPIVIPATDIDVINAYLWWTSMIYKTKQVPAQLINQIIDTIQSY